MISVVIATASNDIIWEGLEQLLNNEPDFDVPSVDGGSILNDMLSSHCPQNWY
jgi:hypothetical protein